MGIEMLSSAIQPGHVIPTKYTCDGANVAPPLKWFGVPAEAKSLALICEDPDAPSGLFAHWVLYGLSVSTSELPEDFSSKPSSGVQQGRNDFGRTGFGGPCPPRGSEHRYYFRLYALDAALNLPAGLTRAQLLQKIEGHVLASGELMGKYGRR